MFIYLFLISIYLFTFFTYNNIKTKLLLNTVLLLTTIFWLIANYYTGEGINQAVLFTISNSIQGTPIDLLIMPISIGLITLFITGALCILIKKYHQKNRYSSLFESCYWILIILFTAFSPITHNIYHLISNYFRGNAQLVAAEYLQPEKISIEKPYNYVIILAESLERTFRDNQRQDYTPRISALAQTGLDFSNITQIDGMGFTAAGLVNVFCNIPFSGKSQLIPEQGFLRKAKCSTDYLRQAGYTETFLLGADPAFSAISTLLKQHGFSTIKDLNYFQTKGLANKNNTSLWGSNNNQALEINGWGINDDVLLEYAWTDFKNLSQQQQPFLQAILTVNTHFPKGKFLPSCQGKIDPNVSDPLLKAVMCNDYLIDQFITKIQNSPYYDNTIIVLVSDHLFPTNDLKQFFKSDTRRNNFIILKKDIQAQKIDKQGSLFDVFPTIFDLAGIKNYNIGFGRSLLNTEKNPLIENYNKKHEMFNYMAYAKTLWSTKLANTRSQFVYKNNQLYIDDKAISIPMYSKINPDTLELYEFYPVKFNDVKYKDEALNGFVNIFNAYECDDKKTACVDFYIQGKKESLVVTDTGIVSRKKYRTW